MCLDAAPPQGAAPGALKAAEGLREGACEQLGDLERPRRAITPLPGDNGSGRLADARAPQLLWWCCAHLGNARAGFPRWTMIPPPAALPEFKGGAAQRCCTNAPA